MQLNYEGFDEATVAVLKSEAVQTALAAAYAAKHEEDEKPLRATRDRLMSEKAALDTKVKEFEALGGLEALKKTKDPAPAKKEPESNAQVEALQAELKKMKDQATEKDLRATLTREIAAAKGTPELLEHAVKSRIKYGLNEEGNLDVTVLDSAGNELYVNGQKAGVKDLLSELRNSSAYARAFDATPVSGGGAKPTAQTSNENPFATATFNATKQSLLVKQDPGRAKQLADAAGVKIAGLNAD